MARTTYLDPKTTELVNQLEKIKLNVDSRKLSELVETANALAEEEGFPDFDIDPAVFRSGSQTAPGIPQLPPGTTLDLTHPRSSYPACQTSRSRTF